VTNPWISEHQYISSASVPVIKLKFAGKYFGSAKDY